MAHEISINTHNTTQKWFLSFVWYFWLHLISTHFILHVCVSQTSHSCPDTGPAFRTCPITRKVWQTPVGISFSPCVRTPNVSLSVAWLNHGCGHSGGEFRWRNGAEVSGSALHDNDKGPHICLRVVSGRCRFMMICCTKRCDTKLACVWAFRLCILFLQCSHTLLSLCYLLANPHTSILRVLHLHHVHQGLLKSPNYRCISWQFLIEVKWSNFLVRMFRCRTLFIVALMSTIVLILMRTESIRLCLICRSACCGVEIWEVHACLLLCHLWLTITHILASVQV